MFSKRRPAVIGADFLPEEIFSAQAFQTQSTANLFDFQALPLKNAIDSILKELHSEENLEFLDAIYKLNANKRLTPLDADLQLRVIEKKFIAANAETQLNIDPHVLNEIVKLSKPRRELHHYQDAIREIFVLIKTNIDTHLHSKPKVKALVEALDRTTFTNTEINRLALELNRVTQVETLKLGVMEAFASRNRDTSLFVKCQKVCVSAQKKMYELINKNSPDNNNTTHDNLAKMLFSVRKTVEKRIGEVQIAEIKKGFTTIKTHALNEALENINRVISTFKFTDSPKKAPRSNRVSPIIEERSLSDFPTRKRR